MMSKVNDDIPMLILFFRIRVPVGGPKTEADLSPVPFLSRDF